MTDNIVDFTGLSKLDLNPDRLLKGSIGKLESVLILGYTKEGSDFFKCSKADASEAIYFMERAKHRLMKVIDDGHSN